MDEATPYILPGSERTRLEVEGSYDDIPNAVRAAYSAHLKDTLSSLILEPEFKAKEVPFRFKKAALHFIPLVPEAILAEEKRLEVIPNEPKPIQEALAKLAMGDENPTFAVDPAFIEHLYENIDDLPHDHFKRLEEYREALDKTHIIELMSRVEVLVGQSKNPEWLNQSYELVKEASQHPEQYTPPLDSPNSVMLLCFVNYYTRQLTRRLVTNNLVMTSLTEKLGEITDEDSLTMLQALKMHFDASALSGQQWTDLVGLNSGYYNEQNIEEMATQQENELHALAAMERVSQTPGGQKVIEVWQEVAERLSEEIDKEYEISRITFWQNTDIGHTFQRFNDFQVMDAVRENRMYRFNRPPKTNGAVAIFEDDNRQMTRWKRIMDEHSSYAVTDEYCSDNMMDIDSLGDNPEVTMFLLDIQNGQDKTAGIRLAESLLRQRLDSFDSHADDENSPKTKIIVWSTSDTSARQATDQLGDFLKQLPGEQLELIHAESHFGRILRGYRIRSPIELEVRLKVLDRYVI
jgi:hypothetical protein